MRIFENELPNVVTVLMRTTHRVRRVESDFMGFEVLMSLGEF